MNSVDARSVQVYGGYQGEFRKVHRARFEPVCENGIPIIFPTAEKAEIAAWHALRSHLCGEIVGDASSPKTQRTKSEELFGAIFKNGKKIPVVEK